VAPKSLARFVSRPSPAPLRAALPANHDVARAVLPLTFEDELAIIRFDDMTAFSRLWAHAVADGTVRLSSPLPVHHEEPRAATLIIGTDRFPAQRLRALDAARVDVELLPSPALLNCIARHARSLHAGRPILLPDGVTRSSHRFETALDVQFTDVPHLAERYAADISKGGLFVACTPQPELRSRLTLRMSLPQGPVVEVPVEVVHREVSGPSPGVGVQFVGPTAEVMKPIVALLEQYQGRRPRVLVIDDEAIWRSTLSRVLTSMGVDVVLAKDGREGLNRLTDLLFELDLVVLDLHMPIIDGRGLLERVRRHGNETGLRLFLFSAASPEELRALGEEALANAVFSKLDPLQSLVKRLATELGRPEPTV
jgi:CheY-like chemotaxis protein